MANGFYQFGMQQWAEGAIHWKTSGGDTFRCFLIDGADYSYDLAAHDYLDHVAAGREEGPASMANPVSAADGIIDADNITFAGATGDPCEGLLIYKFGTGDADSPLLIWIDTATGLPVTLNGGDVTVTWDNTTNKIAKI